jgi:hypothetical protein
MIFLILWTVIKYYTCHSLYMTTSYDRYDCPQPSYLLSQRGVAGLSRSYSTVLVKICRSGKKRKKQILNGV